jgi:hypothetical protein
MRKLATAALSAILAVATLATGPTVAQPQDRDWRAGQQGWRGDQAPDERWLDRDDFERRGRNDIDCPLSQVRREITTQLPDGWWNTPSVDRLSGTEVQVIGGRRTLACKYGQSGQIMRLEPRGRDCVARRTGFDCQRRRPGFPIPGPGGNWPGGPGGFYNQGSVELRQTYQMDLDSGRVGGSGSDLWFHALSPVDLYLEPVGGARLAFMGGGGRQDCRDANLSGDRVALGRVNVGTVFCYRTGEGRLGQFRVTGFSNQGQTRIMTLDYETWNSRDR